MILYHIRNWQEIFENNETRKLKNLRWVATPNKHDGIEFRRLMRQKNGAQLFAAFILMIEVASKTQPTERRGYLERDGIPLSPDALGDATGMSGNLFKQALDYFSNHGNTWIEALNVEPPDTSGNNPEASGTSPTEWKGGKGGKEGNIHNVGDKSPPVCVGFKKPLKSECIEYGKEIGFDGELFFDGCEARGWMVGKAKMKDWRAAMRTWKKNNFNIETKGASKTQTLDRTDHAMISRLRNGLAASGEPLSQEERERIIGVLGDKLPEDLKNKPTMKGKI